MNGKKVVQDDILRYKKNKLASMLALLGLAFTALYFALLYSVNNGYFYTVSMGLSVIVTLVLLLTAFLCSESIKNYRKGYCITLLVLAAINIGRIFYYPMQGLKANAFDGAIYFWTEMSNGGIFTMLVIYLVASAACYVGSAVVGYIYAVRLENHTKAVEAGAVSVEEALEELEKEEETRLALEAETAAREAEEAQQAEAQAAEEQPAPAEENNDTAEADNAAAEDSSSGEEK